MLSSAAGDSIFQPLIFFQRPEMTELRKLSSQTLLVVTFNIIFGLAHFSEVAYFEIKQHIQMFDIHFLSMCYVYIKLNVCLYEEF